MRCKFHSYRVNCSSDLAIAAFLDHWFKMELMDYWSPGSMVAVLGWIKPYKGTLWQPLHWVPISSCWSQSCMASWWKFRQHIESWELWKQLADWVWEIPPWNFSNWWCTNWSGQVLGRASLPLKMLTLAYWTGGKFTFPIIPYYLWWLEMWWEFRCLKFHLSRHLMW